MSLAWFYGAGKYLGSRWRVDGNVLTIDSLHVSHWKPLFEPSEAAL